MQANSNSLSPRSCQSAFRAGWVRCSASFTFLFLLATSFVAQAQDDSAKEESSSSGNLPYVINLRPFYRNTFGSKGGYHNFNRSQVIDGLPFKVLGQVELYGRTGHGNVPKNIPGIRISRAFEELHLIHDVVWEDPVGQTVAIIRLHYEGGSHHDFQVQYGVHVMDWNRLLSEEFESLDEPDSKIIWHYPGANKGTGRLFKTVFHNPQPKKKVETMELISGEGWSSYKLAAATVANSDPKRAVTPGLPLNDPPRHFDGKLTIKLVDEKTGRPIPHVDINGFTTVNGEGIVMPPVRSDSNGEAVLKYPSNQTANLGFRPVKAGYQFTTDWQSWKGSEIPQEVTCTAIAVHQPLLTPAVFVPSVLALALGLFIFSVSTMWFIFSKANYPSWAGFVPFYNAYTMLKVAGKPGWWLVLLCLPVVGLVFGILMALGLARNFGKGGGFAAGLVFLPFIFYPILAFGKATYQAGGDAPSAV